MIVVCSKYSRCFSGGMTQFAKYFCHFRQFSLEWIAQCVSDRVSIMSRISVDWCASLEILLKKFLKKVQRNFRARMCTRPSDNPPRFYFNSLPSPWSLCVRSLKIIQGQLVSTLTYISAFRFHIRFKWSRANEIHCSALIRAELDNTECWKVREREKKNENAVSIIWYSYRA